MRHLDIETKAPLYTYFEETATGLSHIQAFKWQEKNVARGISLLEESQKPFYTMLAIQQWLAMVLGLLTAALGILLVALAVFIDHSSSAPAIGLSFIGLTYLSLALENTLMAWATLETSSSCLARLGAFSENTPQETIQTSVSLPENWPAQGKVELHNVCAHYVRSDETRPALKDVSLEVLPGERVGIAGRSGSGKSTLLMTLLGFIEYDGRIEIDGIDIASLSCADLRSRLITLSQTPVQFDATIRTNLVPLTMNDPEPRTVGEVNRAREADAELKRVLKSLHIWMPIAEKGGLDAMLGDVGYSKGQIQLLALARAVLKQRHTGRKVILVDEATSSVDASTEKIAQRTMKEEFAGCTILTIGHRQSSFSNVDRVVHLSNGAVVPQERASSDDSADEGSR